MNAQAGTRLRCPACGADWQYGWEGLREVVRYLVGGVTRCGREGAVRYNAVRCEGCKSVFPRRDVIRSVTG